MDGADRVDATRVIDEARRICAVPAPTFAEAARGDLVAELLSQAGVVPERDAAGNVVAALGGGGGGGGAGGGGAVDADAVIVAAHLDTVFAHETEIRFVEEPGRLAAPGIGDNSVAVAALLHLARRFGGRTLRRPLVLAATVGEEGLGDLRGAKALLEERLCGTFIALEGQMLDTITVAAVGALRLVASVTGPGGHPWSDRGTPSAVHGLVTALAGALTRVDALGVVLNIGVIGGGTVINAIADHARAEIDVRSEDARALGDAAVALQDALAGLEPPLQATLEQVGHRPGGQLAAGHPLVAAARRARERAGLGPVAECASSTDANAAHGRGIPAITVGVTTGGNAHRLNEYIDLAPVPQGLAALEALVEELVADG